MLNDVELSLAAQKLNGWIILGSATETILQIFMAFYISDYKNTNWCIWEDCDVEIIKNRVFECVNSLKDDNIIDASKTKSLKNAVNRCIKTHTKEHNIEDVMLDELIQLYTSEELLDSEEIIFLKEIQRNRNGIHSFKKRDIGSWNELGECVLFLCYLMEWITYRLPDVPDCDEYWY